MQPSYRKILQIIPADGWSVVFENNQQSPLACWALIEDEDGNTKVLGMDGAGEDVYFAEDNETFSRYGFVKEKDWDAHLRESRFYGSTSDTID